ncbi:ester cyclase [Oceaniglobus trochenteri]|uniref:nuclear transport factor 2 family protein n=1 Tax=Oceaniglobus trochenteri TaxID=2763260 RepID=UPI001CFFCE61|nr:ester cyclase [Oceaniglobus trochenteri]
MLGFDKRFADFPDYIIKITEDIWEKRGLATLHDTYDPEVIMRSPGGVIRGNVAVINNTMESISEAPDRQLLAEDVIWSGDDETGYLSSHRVLSFGTHTGHGRLGAPTGRSFAVRAVADCAAKQNLIYDEWLTRDNSGLALQLGLDPVEFVRQGIEDEGGPEKARRPFHPKDDVQGLYTSRGNDNEWGQRLGDILTRMMNADFTVIQKEYDRAVRTEHPGNRTGWSWAFPETNWMRLRAAFPSAEFKIEHQIGREDPLLSPRAAIRWSMLGRHDGYGAFGAPTGAEVYIMGFTQAEFGPWGLRKEYTVYDEMLIWKQIMLHTGNV